MADWKYLPDQLLDSIIEKLESPIDYLRFSAICAQWNHIAKDNESKRSKMLRYHQVPMLLLPNIEEEHTFRLYDVMDNKFLETKLSVPYSKRFSGSSQGWLISVDEKFGVTIYKPFSMVKESTSDKSIDTIIHLPCLFPADEDFVEVHDYHIPTATITADPLENPNDCILRRYIVI